MKQRMMITAAAAALVTALGAGSALADQHMEDEGVGIKPTAGIEAQTGIDQQKPVQDGAEIGENVRELGGKRPEIAADQPLEAQTGIDQTKPVQEGVEMPSPTRPETAETMDLERRPVEQPLEAQTGIDQQKPVQDGVETGMNLPAETVSPVQMSESIGRTDVQRVRDLGTVDVEKMRVVGVDPAGATDEGLTAAIDRNRQQISELRDVLEENQGLKSALEARDVQPDDVIGAEVEGGDSVILYTR